MTINGLLLFATIYFAAVISPGPGVAAIIARALRYGLGGIWPFIAGFFAGDLVWFLVAVAGLGVIAKTYADVLIIIKLAGAAYLLYIAWKMWSAPVEIAEPGADEVKPQDSALKLFLASFSLTIGNPKPIVFFMAVLPSIVDLTTITPLATLEIAATMSLVITAGLMCYAVPAARARKLLKSKTAVRILNRGTGLVMAGAAVAIARS